MRHPNRDYKNYKKITVEPISNYNAVIVGILLMIVFYFIRAAGNQTTILIAFMILSRIIFVPWIYKIAKKAGKDETLWIILGIISPPISLIILGFSDLKVDSIVAMKIIKEKREEFKNEEFIAKQTLNQEELTEKIEEIKKRLNHELQVELKEYYK